MTKHRIQNNAGSRDILGRLPSVLADAIRQCRSTPYGHAVDQLFLLLRNASQHAGDILRVVRQLVYVRQINVQADLPQGLQDVLDEGTDATEQQAGLIR